MSLNSTISKRKVAVLLPCTGADSSRWVCPRGCGSVYEARNERFINAHTASCVYVIGQGNDDLQPSPKRRKVGHKHKRRRRKTSELPEKERWYCPIGCGVFFAKTSTNTIKRHMRVCQPAAAGLVVPPPAAAAKSSSSKKKRAAKQEAKPEREEEQKKPLALAAMVDDLSEEQEEVARSPPSPSPSLASLDSSATLSDVMPGLSGSLSALSPLSLSPRSVSSAGSFFGSAGSAWDWKSQSLPTEFMAGSTSESEGDCEGAKVALCASAAAAVAEVAMKGVVEDDFSHAVSEVATSSSSSMSPPPPPAACASSSTTNSHSTLLKGMVEEEPRSASLFSGAWSGRAFGSTGPVEAQRMPSAFKPPASLSRMDSLGDLLSGSSFKPCLMRDDSLRDLLSGSSLFGSSGRSGPSVALSA